MHVKERTLAFKIFEKQKKNPKLTKKMEITLKLVEQKHKHFPVHTS